MYNFEIYIYVQASWLVMNFYQFGTIATKCKNNYIIQRKFTD